MTLNYWEEDEENWSYCYGNNGPEGIIKSGQYDMIMAGGGSHWSNYVIKKDGVYIENTNGLTKLNKILVSSPDGNYISEQDLDYELKEDESDLFESIIECYEEEFNEYELEKEIEEEEEEIETIICDTLYQEEKSIYKINECICKNCKTENKEWIEVLKPWDEWGTCKKCNIKWKLNKK